MRAFIVSAIALTCLALTGCEKSEWQKTYEENRENERRLLKYKADILEMYRDCLKNKQKNPKVDCSEFRTALEIKLPK